MKRLYTFLKDIASTIVNIVDLYKFTIKRMLYWKKQGKKES
jgi:hypothetical protein